MPSSFAPARALELFPRGEDLVRRVAKRAADPQTGVVPEIAAYLAYYHRNAVGAELDPELGVEVVYRLYQSDTAHLKEVVRVLAPARELLYDRQHKPQVAGDELIPRGAVARLRRLQKSLRLLSRQYPEL